MFVERTKIILFLSAIIIVIIGCDSDNKYAKTQDDVLSFVDLSMQSLSEVDGKKVADIQFANNSDSELILSSTSSEIKLSADWIMLLGNEAYLAKEIHPHPVLLRPNSKSKVRVVFERFPESVKNSISSKSDMLDCRFLSYSINGKKWIEKSFSVKLLLEPNK